MGPEPTARPHCRLGVHSIPSVAHKILYATKIGHLSLSDIVVGAKRHAVVARFIVYMLFCSLTIGLGKVMV